MSYRIETLNLRGILDSRGETTVEAEVSLAGGARGVGSTPRAIAPGRRERARGVIAGLGPRHAGRVPDALQRCLVGRSFADLGEFDRTLDRIHEMEFLGANVTLSVSLAFARACAFSEGTSLSTHLAAAAGTEPGMPRPLINLLSGGIHSTEHANPFQQIMLVSFGNSIQADVEAGLAVYRTVEERLAAKGITGIPSASSGLLVSGMSWRQLLEFAADAAAQRSSTLALAVDVAAEHLHQGGGRYRFGEEILDGDAMLEHLCAITTDYGVALVEDPFDPDDAPRWLDFTRRMRGRVEVIGDDLYATDPNRIDAGLATGILLKMDQIGTLTGTLSAAARARAAGMTLCISHRSGETEDTAMCDLAVALGAGFIKIGGPRRGDRISKYNQLLRLDEQLGDLRNRAAA
jgi:enolase